MTAGTVRPAPADITADHPMPVPAHETGLAARIGNW
jgi:hypothetical protein